MKPHNYKIFKCIYIKLVLIIINIIGNMEELAFLIQYFKTLNLLTDSLRLAMVKIFEQSKGAVDQQFIEKTVTEQVIKIMDIDSTTLAKMVVLAKHLDDVRTGHIPEEIPDDN